MCLKSRKRGKFVVFDLRSLSNGNLQACLPMTGIDNVIELHIVSYTHSLRVLK